MTMAKIGKKFPWKTLLLGILCAILLIVLIGVLIPGVGTFLLGLSIGIGTLIVSTAIACFTNLYFWAGFGIMGVIFFIYFYRKNYAKHKVIIAGSTGGGLPMSDRLATPLFDEDTKVESA